MSSPQLPPTPAPPRPRWAQLPQLNHQPVVLASEPPALPIPSGLPAPCTSALFSLRTAVISHRPFVMAVKWPVSPLSAGENTWTVV